MHSLSLSSGLLTIKYGCPAQILEALCQFREQWSRTNGGASPNLAWIYASSSATEPSTNVLAAYKFAPEHTFYIEAIHPQRALAAACDENFFHAIVYNAKTSAAALQIARRWLKPTHRPLVAKGEELERFTTNKLVILADEL